MKKQLGLVAGVFLASTSCFAADSFQVETSVYKANELLASPEMLVEEKQPASISIGEGFSYEVKVTPLQNNTAAIETSITLAGRSFAPSFVVEYSKQASFEIGENKMSILVTKSKS
ncbi:hypothetical protein NH514_20325 [Pseudoalteromonas sp. ACER1]|uniref:hypothetical protein n=1 Tax=unclassified Pseudoalteromonas TaxID=194690 RepID=UPI001F1BFE5A|nr:MULTISPECIES: hypothetical protein [unclassified Pseudoalteromonas]MCF2849548.1 hypothetical protein [Pseudoalteromonas sp. PAST1]MCO7213038.1 hypothetical protein [Pseudoalteromonas sp. ACER1]